MGNLGTLDFMSLSIKKQINKRKTVMFEIDKEQESSVQRDRYTRAPQTRGHPIHLVTSIITDQIGRHEVLLPINDNHNKIGDILGFF